jgi:hypothetical protein
MLIKNNSLIISSNQKDSLKIFIKNMYLLFKKYKIKLNYFNKKEVQKKFTILRSPHVHKSARDQIELYTIKHFFYFDQTFLTKFFFKMLDLKKNAFKFKYTLIKKQKLLFFFNKVN